MKYWQKVRVTSWFYEGAEWLLYKEYTIQDWWNWETPVNRRNTYNIKVWNEVLPEIFELSNFELI
jgi:hypothetical protein